MTANDHGSASTYTNHACRCTPCREAGTRAVRARREARRVEGVPASTAHGRESTYQNWSCRCVGCRAAHAAYSRSRYAARRATALANQAAS